MRNISRRIIIDVKLRNYFLTKIFENKRNARAWQLTAGRDMNCH